MGKNLQHNIIKLAFVRADGIGTFEFDMKKTLNASFALHFWSS